MKTVVFITGCASGIGKSLSLSFYNKGYNVVITDINYEKLDWTNQLEKERILVEKLDVRDYSNWEDLINKTLNKFSKIDILINNAGIMNSDYIWNMKVEDIQNEIDTNLKGVVIGSMIASKIMIKQGHGHIINISSLAGIAPIPGISIYTATKFAVRGFSIAIAYELKKFNVFVSVICPDAVKTPLIENVKDKPSSAIVFSGFKILDIKDVEKAVFKAIKTKKLEILIPLHRSIMAKLVNTFPSLGFLFEKPLTYIGLKRIKKI